MSRWGIRIITIACRRGCGKRISTVSRSITGADAAHAKYSGICGECITEEEKHDMHQAQLSALLKRQHN